MNTKILPLFCLFFLILFNLSFRFPVDNGRITSTYGESRGDHFHDGVDIISGDRKIYPVSEGELIFFWDKSIFPTENYPGSGNYKILSHKNNLYSLYMHMNDALSQNKNYSTNDILGIIGNTGHSSGKHLHFCLLDISRNVSINPFLLLPPIKDIKNPKILEIFIRIDDRYFTINENDTISLTQHHPLLIKIIDSIKMKERLGIYRLKLIFNNATVMDIKFSEICFSKNGLTISNKTFHHLYDRKGYYKLDNIIYNNGSNHLTIITYDFSKNKAIKKLSFNAKLEIE